MFSRISTGNLKAYHMSILPVKVISEDSFFSLGVDGGGGGGGGGLASQASYAIMPLPFQVYDDYYVLTSKCAT